MPIVINGTASDDTIDDTLPLGRTPEESETINGLGGNDTIYGFGGDDRLDGGEGNDILIGGAGNDVLYDYRNSVGGDTNILDGGDGDDSFYQSLGINTMYGGAGRDFFSFNMLEAIGKNTIYGGEGYDTLESGIQRDRDNINFGYDISSQIIFDVEHLIIGSKALTLTAEQVSQFDEITIGADPGGPIYPTIRIVGSGSANFADRADLELLVYASDEGNKISAGKHNDNLQGGDGDDWLESGGGSDWLDGDAGNDLLDGGSGADRMLGRTGDDTYAVDDADDQVSESFGEGNDLIVSTVSYALSAYENIETLQLAKATGSASLNLTGGNSDNTLRGNKGANVLDGKGGADSLYGKAGDDTYAIDNAGDRVFEAVGEGRDLVVSTISYALKAGQEIEALQLAKATGTTNYSLEGNEFGQLVMGNAGANKLNGGLGNDTLTGKAGADTFVFTTKLGPDNVDHITDFAPVDDTIRLAKSLFTALGAGLLAASAFKDVSVSGTVIDRDDRLIYDGRDGHLYYDTNGSDAGGRTLFAILDNHAKFTAADIIVA